MVLPAETRVSQEADHATDEQVLHPNIGSWDSLPLELRLIIVGMLDVPTLRSFSSVSSACRAFCFRFLFKAMCFSSRPETTPSLASKMESFCSQSQVSLAMRANLDRIRLVDSTQSYLDFKTFMNLAHLPQICQVSSG